MQNFKLKPDIPKFYIFFCSAVLQKLLECPYKPKPDIPKCYNFFCSASLPLSLSAKAIRISLSNLSQVFPYFTIFPALPLSHSAVLQKPPQMVISLKNDGISNLKNDISKFYHFFCSSTQPLCHSAIQLFCKSPTVKCQYLSKMMEFQI